jgi:hypothetical protein
MEAFPQNLQNVLRFLQRLPDDLLIPIYTTHLRRYRIDKDGNFIRLIDFENYKFLEILFSRKMVRVSKVNIYEDNSGRILPNNILRVEYTLPNCSKLPDREKQSIKNDKMDVYLDIKENTVSYTITQYRLVKIDEFFTEGKPFCSIYHRGHYHRGNYENYDWQVFTIASDGSNQRV